MSYRIMQLIPSNMGFRLFFIFGSILGIFESLKHDGICRIIVVHISCIGSPTIGREGGGREIILIIL